MKRLCFLGIIAILIVFTIQPQTVQATNKAYLDIATTDTRTLSIDKLIYTAMEDAGLAATFAVTQLETGYGLANSGEKDGVISSTPDIELKYKNLVKVPVLLEEIELNVYVLNSSGLSGDSWAGFSGLRVGMLAQRPFTVSLMPDDAVIITKDSNKQLQNGLLEGEFDVIVLSHRVHETVNWPDRIEFVQTLAVLPEYLYLNKRHSALVPMITNSLESLFKEGRAERILNDLPATESNKRQTILHIISTNTEVTREATFITTLRDHFKNDDSIEWYTLELSTKRYSTDPNRMLSFIQLLRQDFISREVSAIVVSGNDGLELLKDYYFLLFRNVPVLYYSICGDQAEATRGFESYFTGLTESIEAYETVDYALKLFPETKTVMVLNDYTTEGNYYGSEIKAQLEPLSDRLDIRYNDDVRLSEILVAIRELPPDSIVLVGSYFLDANKQYYSQNEMKKLLETYCSVPVFAIFASDLGYNAIGGKCDDYVFNGTTIAGVLEKIMNGVPVNEITMPNREDGIRWVFDKNRMDAFGIRKSALPDGAEIQNTVPSIWESDPRFAITLVVLAIMGVSISIGLSVFLYKYNRQREHLQTARELLSKDEKIREVKEQLERIINSAPLAFMMTRDGIIIDANEYSKKHFGVKIGDDIKGRYIDIAERDYLIECASQQDIVKNEMVRYALKDGESHRFLASVSLVEYDKHLTYVLWGMDVEDREVQKDALQKARQNTQETLDSIPAAVMLADVETATLTYANNIAHAMFGYDPSGGLHGKPMTLIMPKEQPNGSDLALLTHQILHTEKSAFFDVYCVTAQGGLLDARITALTIDYNDRPACLMIIQDLAEIKELERTQKSLQTIMDTMPAPVSIMDIGTRRIVYGNNIFLAMHEYPSPESLYEKGPGAILAPEQRSGLSVKEQLDHLLSLSESVSTEVQSQTATGRIIDVRIQTAPISYKGMRSILGIMTDLTAEREYERMLMNTAEREKEANQLKGRFLVNMSHEIRTPMNVIIGLTEIELRKVLPKENYELYRKINLSAKNLLNIINDILDLSKIEANKIELYIEEFELEEVISSALLVASPRLDGKNVEFLLNESLELPRFVSGDKTRLWQILKNFLDNAAKYTDEGKIILAVYPEATLSDDETITLVFVVQDTGIGIDNDQIERIFKPYEQIYSEAQKRYTGTGLGMVISKQLVELMGGRIRIESSPGEGTTIHLTIPFKRSANHESTRYAVTVPELAGINILAVDDDDLSLSIMAGILNNSNAHCDLAHSGEEAIKIIINQRSQGKEFDLILLDYMMDGLNGLETAKKIQSSLSKTPKLLMVTAYQRLLLKPDMDKCNIYDIIEKPFIPSQFIQKINAALGRSVSVVNEQPEAFMRYKDVRVLVCEDYNLNYEVASGMFAQFGVKTHNAENGRHALEILDEDQSFDLIFMDLQMPVMDGFEATQLIRQDSRFDAIPIISMTADAMQEIEAKCREVGMNDHVVKPVQFDQLKQVLLAWIPEEKRITEMMTKPAQNPLDDGLSRFGGNVALYEKALRELAGDLPDDWPEFDNAMMNMQNMKRFVHKINGASGNLGEKELYQYATAFDSSLRNGDPSPELYRKLISASHAFKKKVSDMDKTQKTTGLETGTLEMLKRELTQLQEALSDYDMRNCTVIINSMREKVWPPTDALELEILYKQADNYEYEDAMATVTGMLVRLKRQS